MNASGIGTTDIGKTREQNEDQFLVDNDLGLFIVSDGMGGHAAGEVASATAVRVVAEELQSRRDLLERVRRGEDDVSVVDGLVGLAIQTASSKVYEMAKSVPGRAGMGCTLTLLLIAGDKAVVGHVGDTRLYLLRGVDVHQLTTDHSFAAELARRGLIKPDEVRGHPHANVLTRAIGAQPTVQVETLVIDVVPDDRFLLCSDGLSNYAEDARWLATTLASTDFDGLPDELVSFANEQGGHDNITAVVVQVEAPERPVEASIGQQVQIRFDALGSVFLFQELSLVQLARVLDACKIEHYESKETAICEGEPSSALLVVVDGRFSLSRNGLALAELDAGDHIGATTLLRQRPARAALTALEPSQLLRLEIGPFRALLKARPWLGVALLERLGRWLSRDRDESREELERRDRKPDEPVELF